MARRSKKQSGMSMPLRLLLAGCMLAMCALMLFHGRAVPMDAGALRADLTPVETTPRLLADASDLEHPALAENTPAPSPELPQRKEIVYDEESRQLVLDMISAYQTQDPDRARIIAEDAAALKEHEPRLGEAWEGIMDYWDFANTRNELNYDRLPEDLPQDDSLCIVVLGFQLQADGSMSAEMHGRCELALRAAQQYPEAFLALTGGGTAYQNPEATEAGVMAAWFLRHGISEERLILEDLSTTTEQNATFTRDILTQSYPQVKSLVIVTSDYHVPLGSLMFTEAALLYACETGEIPFVVASNLALGGYGIYEYKKPAEQALYVRSMAGLRLTNP